MLIRVKDRLAALWPFLGIVGEVTLLIGIIFLYEKKSKKVGDPASARFAQCCQQSFRVVRDYSIGDCNIIFVFTFCSL